MNKKDEIVFVEDRFDRDAPGIPCPECNGYCDKEYGAVSSEDLAKHQTCGRSYVCCAGEFRCRLCKKVFAVRLHAPECGW